MSKKRIIIWAEIFDRLAQMDDKRCVVYGIPKGGMILTAFLKNAKVTHDPHKATLFLDDLIDSGATRDKFAKMFPDIPFIGLFDKLQDGITDWLIFPWENDHPSEKVDSVQENIVRIFQYIGENPKREGLLDTPNRVVKMWGEVFRGYNPELKPKVSVFKNGLDGLVYDQMIIDSGEFYSMCEHHMVPFFGRYSFGYIPDPEGNIIGLSKVARIIDYHAAKLQVQERLVHDVVEDLWSELSKGNVVRPIGMGLVMEAEHLCKTMRGARKKGKMTTTKLKGAFFDNPMVRQEFLQKVYSDK